MSRKIIGVVVAFVLAVVGTISLVAYVASAENRALAGEELVQVYVVTSPVPAGTPAEDLEQFVAVEEIPAKVRATGAAESLPALAGRITAVDLVPGEQLVDSRLVERAAFTDRGAGVAVPDDMVEVTIKLDPQRAVGGLLEPGQTVAVFSSFEPFDLSTTVVNVDGKEVALPQAVAAEVDGKTPNSTDIILHQVLVTAVQMVQDPAAVGVAPSGGDEEVDRLTTAPSEEVYVTLAVTPFDAERLVFTAEFGQVWLGAERDTVSDGVDPVQTRGSVYTAQPAPGL
ncbi:MAG: RcpC/CpaB family pilus assembly protein [Acidimicrobiia bacterium]|nr:RcpC/CpaB family pilus assembly protein [Acidimicrobiia bacterium]